MLNGKEGSKQMQSCKQSARFCRARLQRTDLQCDRAASKLSCVSSSLPMANKQVLLQPPNSFTSFKVAKAFVSCCCLISIAARCSNFSSTSNCREFRMRVILSTIICKSSIRSSR